jgi:hypothetical protein
VLSDAESEYFDGVYDAYRDRLPLGEDQLRPPSMHLRFVLLACRNLFEAVIGTLPEAPAFDATGDDTPDEPDDDDEYDDGDRREEEPDWLAAHHRDHFSLALRLLRPSRFSLAGLGVICHAIDRTRAYVAPSDIHTRLVEFVRLLNSALQATDAVSPLAADAPIP